MGRFGVRRSKHTPLRIEPQSGQPREHFPERVTTTDGEKAPDVFDESEPGVGLANDSQDVRPQPARVVDAAAVARNGCRLAWETGSDEIHASTPRAAIEGREIAPDRSAIHGLVRHPRHESGRSEGVVLDPAYDASAASEESSGSEVQASDPGT
jgi:hypothetical protein